MFTLIALIGLGLSIMFLAHSIARPLCIVCRSNRVRRGHVCPACDREARR